MSFVRRVSSEAWIEVSYAHGRFWVRHDTSLWDLLDKVQHGGFAIAKHAKVRQRRK